MAGDFHESYQGETVVPPTPRATGFVFAGAALIGAIVLRNSTFPPLPIALAAASAAFLAVASWAPDRLSALNRAWFQLAMLMNKVVSPFVMLVLFALVIVPFGLVMQTRRDPLRKHRAAEGQSYWIARSPAAASSMRNQF